MIRAILLPLALATSTLADSQPAPSADAPSPGRIVVFRPSSIKGLASACPVRFKGRQIVELGRGRYAGWPVAPGRYILSNKASSIEVNVGAGETRYVRCHMKIGGMTYMANLEIAESEDFTDHAADFAETPADASGADFG